jgi:amino acid adenylation domain-containing protein
MSKAFPDRAHRVVFYGRTPSAEDQAMAAFCEPPQFSNPWEPIEHFASLTPGHPAIDDGINAYSYAQLCRGMNAAAAALKSLGLVKGDRVGILIDNGILAYASVLGALRAGGCYVALNPSLPPTRLHGIIADAEPRVLVVSEEYLELLARVLSSDSAVVNNFYVLVLHERESAPVAPESLTSRVKGLHFLNPFCEGNTALVSVLCDGDDLAYLMYTSGSTGRPKGVMVSRENVMTFVRWAQSYFSFTPADRFSGHSRLSFDLSVFDMFCAFHAGATLCPITKPEEISFPASFMERQKITVWFSVPSVLRQMLAAGDLTKGRFSKHLRHVIFCGEALLPSQAQAWQETHPDIPLFNLYGPTEATVACSYFRVPGKGLPDSLGSVPIGDACDGTELFLIDDDNRLVAAGEAGRLIVGGAQVAKGYWKNLELTEKVFFSHPLRPGTLAYDTGDLARLDDNFGFVWLGRKDEQVKIHGHRVELGEIENALLRGTDGTPHGFAVEAVALLTSEPHSKIIAVVAPKAAPHAMLHPTEAAKIKAALMTQCLALLPAYMVPADILLADELAKNANGKICRKTIQQMHDVLIENGKVSVSLNSAAISTRLKNEGLFAGSPLPILIFELARLLSKQTIVSFHIYFENQEPVREAFIANAERLWPIQIFEALQDSAAACAPANASDAIALRIRDFSTATAPSTSARGIDVLIEYSDARQSHPMTVTITHEPEAGSAMEIARLAKDLRARVMSYSLQPPLTPTPALKFSGQHCDCCWIDAAAYREQFPAAAGMIAYFKDDGQLGRLCHVCADGYR